MEPGDEVAELAVDEVKLGDSEKAVSVDTDGAFPELLEEKEVGVCVAESEAAIEAEVSAASASFSSP